MRERHNRGKERWGKRGREGEERGRKRDRDGESETGSKKVVERASKWAREGVREGGSE